MLSGRGAEAAPLIHGALLCRRQKASRQPSSAAHSRAGPCTRHHPTRLRRLARRRVFWVRPQRLVRWYDTSGRFPALVSLFHASTRAQTSVCWPPRPAGDIRASERVKTRALVSCWRDERRPGASTVELVPLAGASKRRSAARAALRQASFSPAHVVSPRRSGRLAGRDGDVGTGMRITRRPSLVGVRAGRWAAGGDRRSAAPGCAG